MRRSNHERLRGGALASGVAALLVGALGLASYFTFGDSKLDIMGDSPRLRSREETAQLVAERKAALYANHSIAGRYTLLFLQNKNNDRRDTIFVGQLEGGNGVARLANVAFRGGDPHENTFYGQSCLFGSSFDISSSKIRGLTTNGDVSAGATLTINDNQVVISNAGSPEPLRFNQESDGLLQPADAFTTTTLGAYGCKPEITM